MSTPRIYTEDEWFAEGTSRFGPDKLNWRFTCPACGHVASVRECQEAGVPNDAIAFSCVGRWSGAKRVWLGGSGPGPCDYAGGGLFKINPVRVVDDAGVTHEIFAFAEPTAAEPASDEPTMVEGGAL